jgi:3-isopropylmalate/(R)-2-methylmalate dehydratase small subunit
LAIIVESGVFAQLSALTFAPERNALTIDLPRQTVQAQDGSMFASDIDEGRKEVLMLAFEMVAATLQRRAAIHQFEAVHFAQKPWLG